MIARYDPSTDTLTLVLREDVEVSESDEEKPGVILDYDDEGALVSIEILDASQRVTHTQRFDYAVLDEDPLPAKG